MAPQDRNLNAFLAVCTARFMAIQSTDDPLLATRLIIEILDALDARTKLAPRQTSIIRNICNQADVLETRLLKLQKPWITHN